jgi:hypothetical protein
VAFFGGKFEKVVFVVSSGRTGTQALAHHMDRCCQGVCALHEPPPSWRLRRASIKALSGHIKKDELRATLIDLRRGLVSRLDRPIYIESNGLLQGFLEVLPEVFDRPKVVHVVRDPRTYVRSAINFGAMSGLKWMAASFWPYWFPKPEHFTPKRRPGWWEMSPPERLAWVWMIINTQLNRGEQLFGEDYLRIKFEDLFAKDGSGFERLTDWIGLPRSPGLRDAANKENVNASHKERLPKFDQWDPALKTALLRHCGELMRLYGYGLDDVTPAPKQPAAAASA